MNSVTESIDPIHYSGFLSGVSRINIAKPASEFMCAYVQTSNSGTHSIKSVESFTGLPLVVLEHRTTRQQQCLNH